MLGKLFSKENKSLWEILALVAIVLIAATSWAFIEIAEEVLEGETHEFDERIILLMRNPGDRADPWGPDWFEEMIIDLTSLGSAPVLFLVTAACAGGLYISGTRHIAFRIVFAVFGGMIISASLKSGFDRPRPNLIPHEFIVYQQSFPSGHAMVSTVTYLTLGFLLANTYRKLMIQIYIISVALFISLIVGISRIYMGVHWPTDVIAGWAIGSSWALFCWLIQAWFQRKGKIEKVD
jgi:undecaprenyl-diphosphatase